MGRSAVAAAGAFALLILATVVRAPAAEPEAVGRWLAPISEDGDGDGIGDFAEHPPRTAEEAARIPTAVNVVVLPDGRVLYWSQLDGSESVDESIVYQQPERPHSRTRVLDLAAYFQTGNAPSPDAWTVPTPEEGVGGDHLGSDQRLLHDGRALAIGGAEWSNDNEGLPIGRTELYGLQSARIYDPGTNAWTSTGDMNVRRYYPSLVTLPDGKLLVASGAERVIWQTDLLPARHPSGSLLPENVGDVETYDPATGAWTLGDPEARADMVMFAHLHLMPDGRLFHPSVGMIFPPGGADKDMAQWNRQRFYDPATQRWTDAGNAPLGVRGNAFSTLMPLVPPYDRASIIVGGGTLGQWPGSYLATSVTETITWTDGTVERQLGPSMTAPRWHSSAVVLPSGDLSRAQRRRQRRGRRPRLGYRGAPRRHVLAHQRHLDASRVGRARSRASQHSRAAPRRKRLSGRPLPHPGTLRVAPRESRALLEQLQGSIIRDLPAALPVPWTAAGHRACRPGDRFPAHRNARRHGPDPEGRPVTTPSNHARDRQRPANRRTPTRRQRPRHPRDGTRTERRAARLLLPLSAKGQRRRPDSVDSRDRAHRSSWRVSGGDTLVGQPALQSRRPSPRFHAGLGQADAGGSISGCTDTERKGRVFGFQELILLILILVLVGLPIWGIIDAAVRPNTQWQAADQSKVVWVVVQIFLGILGAAAYFIAIRPKLKQASS